MEGGRCIGCQEERTELFRYSRQAVIDGTQITRRNTATAQGQARRFMGRFSGKLGRFR